MSHTSEFWSKVDKVLEDRAEKQKQQELRKQRAATWQAEIDQARKSNTLGDLK